ncbi:MAG TPA: hypothetical protein VMY43_07355 [Methanothrix sp.]|nr:hypothetical protein [Methanothrix sp.]
MRLMECPTENSMRSSIEVAVKIEGSSESSIEGSIKRLIESS